LPVSIMFSINQLVLKNKILLFLYVSSIPRALYYTALSSTLFFYIFPATALPLGSLHIFEIFQDRDRKIAGTISLNESPRIVQNYLSPSDILHMFIFMIKHTF